MHCTVYSLHSFPTSVSFRAFHSTNLSSVSRCSFFLLKEFLDSKPQPFSRQSWIWISHVLTCQMRFFLPLSKSWQSWLYGPGPGVDKTFDFYGNDSKCFMHITHMDRDFIFPLHYWFEIINWVWPMSLFVCQVCTNVCRPTNILINLLHVEYVLTSLRLTLMSPNIPLFLSPFSFPFKTTWNVHVTHFLSYFNYVADSMAVVTPHPPFNCWRWR